MEDIKSYPFLGNKANPIPGMDDSAEFQSTVKAMNIMGMTNEDYAGMYIYAVSFDRTYSMDPCIRKREILDNPKQHCLPQRITLI